MWLRMVKWRACGWSVVQVDFDKRIRIFLHGMYGSMDAELEVQRTIKRAELTAFCLLKKGGWTHQGTWAVERRRECTDPKAGDAHLWTKTWEELQLLTTKEVFVEVEHVKAHRTKDKKEMTQFEKFVTDGDERADELAKEGAMLDEGLMAQGKSKNDSAGARRGARSPAVRSQFFQCLVEEWKDCEVLKPQPKEKWTFCGQERREETRH